MTKTYLELLKLPTFKERFEYLKVDGMIGNETFGHLRYLNQKFYTSKEWKEFRKRIIIRDLGHDLAMASDDYEIHGRIIIHHLNPITPEDILHRSSALFDPNNVVTTSDITHKAIHYGDIDLVLQPIVERKPNDTCPWR